MISLAADF